MLIGFVVISTLWFIMLIQYQPYLSASVVNLMGPDIVQGCICVSYPVVSRSHVYQLVIGDLVREKNKSYCLWGQWEDSSICFWITLTNKIYETRQTRLGSLGIVKIEKMKVFLVENINWTRPYLTKWEKKVEVVYTRSKTTNWFCSEMGLIDKWKVEGVEWGQWKIK